MKFYITKIFGVATNPYIAHVAANCMIRAMENI